MITAAELRKMSYIREKHPASKRHAPAMIERAKAMLLFPDHYSTKAIAAVTGISTTVVKRMRAGRLHVGVKPKPEDVRQLAQELGVPAP